MCLFLRFKSFNSKSNIELNYKLNYILSNSELN